ncbi:DUF2652 domain-containing protein [Chitinophaga sp. SYP-B3965]|uniref:DUF2652 domain-containing protein n=1 Tax=Chitinophaga sp. SYP-B3965 TaxID=2663120 RepID=UPI00129A060E|nr:DUF2652 domain-containing protein [Chitinophaga sp. SYP-B3965]MRG45001.1 DUF2652 domain-containing protein [Chitinophaga sp. SYP-B3965]
MENRGLLFIPDISGFSKFVNEAEIEHSSYIIKDLLEILINANELGLVVSEIEGDAILFYKFGEPADLAAVYRQVEKMFCAFHRYLINYDHRKICQCQACISAVGLSLKVITHYGEFTEYNVKNFSKLIGRDVIVAHQLLKNDIEQHEYWLVTSNMLGDQQPGDYREWMEWNTSARQTEAGEITFHYTQLGQLKNEIPHDPIPRTELKDKVKVFTMSKEFKEEIKKVFYTIVHYEFREHWLEGVVNVKEVSHLIPGVGSLLRGELTNGEELKYYASGFSYHPESRIIFSESDEDNQQITNYIMDKKGPDTTLLTVEYYQKMNVIQEFRFRFGKKKDLEQRYARSLQKLEEFMKEISMPGAF